MMFLLSDAAKVLDGVLVGADGEVVSVGIDSRKATPGMLFFALKGQRDGHEFAQQAIDNGALCAVVDRDAVGQYGTPATAILVADVGDALLRLAKWWRDRFDMPIIAVTGSNGKTTVKEMIASILSITAPKCCYATPGNFNNEIGVPLSLFGLRAHHRFAVIEIGMNHPGEISRLSAVVQPTVALINNAQREHMAFFDSLADVARANAEVFESADPDGVAVINADDDFCDFWCDYNRHRRVVRFGLGPTAEFRASFETLSVGSRIEMTSPAGEKTFFLAAAGRHNVLNALAAAACAWSVGAGIVDIVDGLGQFLPVKGRLQFRATKSGATIIDDTYNANPDSVAAAVDVLTERTGRRILILGDMGEVGRQGLRFHGEIGKLATAGGIDCLLAVGELAIEATRYFAGEAMHFEDKQALIDEVKKQLDEKTTVLVKGSRFMRMEEVVSALLDETR